MRSHNDLYNKALKEYYRMLPNDIDPNLRAIIEPFVKSLLNSILLVLNLEINTIKAKTDALKDKDK